MRFRNFSLISGVSLLAISVSLAFAPGFVPAAFAAGATPSGGQFAAGAGAIAPTANGLSITQSTSRGIIDWQSFSIGQGNAVNIANGSGATLNRVTGGDISNIAGSLTSTGSVYVINPAGIVVMPSGQVVTTGSFVASTRDVSNSSFMAGGAQNFKGTSTGTVVNQGSITSTLGDVTLIGQSVTNSGQISAPNGTVGLAAGDDILLQPSSDPEIVINAGTGDATNSGNIAAAQAELAAAGGNVYALATNNGGVIRATGSATKDGHVYLTAGGNVTVAGTVSATNADGSGGTVKAIAGSAGGILSVAGAVNVSAIAASAKGGIATLTGNTVNIGSTAIISANGGTDGGNIFIGGDRHGGTDPSVTLSATPIPNAQYTTVSAGANIAANGGWVAGTLLGGAGNGGNVVVWSNISTSYAGAISAQGGATGGNGGFVEVSGEHLAFTGTVNTLAPMGGTGTLLLDPSDVTIVSSSDNNGTTTTTNESAGTPYNPTAATSYILNTDIDTALSTSSVIINTGTLGDGVGGTGNVHFGTSNGNNGSNAAPLYWTSNNSLTINALGEIDTNGGTPTSATHTASGADALAAVTAGNLIVTTGTGSITFNAGGNGLASGATAITWGAPIVANGGTVTLAATNPNYQVIIGNQDATTHLGGAITNTYQSSSAPGNVVLQGDIVRLGSGQPYTGTISTTGDVIVMPVSSTMIVGNNNNTPGDGGNSYSSHNTATLDNNSIQRITANTLVLGGSNVTSLTLQSPTGYVSNGINAQFVSNLELVTGTTGGTQSVSQDALTSIYVGGSGNTGNGGLSVVTGGSVSLADFQNTFGTLAIQQLAGGSGGAIAVQGNTTNDNTGTLNIGTVGKTGTGAAYVITGITAPNATVTLINVGSTTQDTTAGAQISANNLILEGAATGPYATYTNYATDTSATYPSPFNGSFTLNNTSNTISNIAGKVSSLSLTDNASLTVAANLSDNLAALTAGSGNVLTSTSFSGITSAATTAGTGGITLVDNGVLTIANGAPITTAAGNVLLEDGSPNYGNGTVAANTGFIDSDGTAAFAVTGAGNYWRVYSQDPRNDNDGGLTAYSFVQYGAANYYGAPTANGAGTSASPSPFTNANTVLAGNYTGNGNGFLYTVVPNIAESITNTFTKTYDGTKSYTASPSPLALTYSGQTASTANTVTVTGINNDAVTVNAQTTLSGTTANFYTSANACYAGNTCSYSVGSNFSNISLNGVVDHNGVVAYGYTATPAVTATATITPASLTITASNQSRVYGPTSYSLGSQTTNYTTTGTLYTNNGVPDSVTSVTLAAPMAATLSTTGVTGANPYAITPSAAVGTGLSNYTINYVAGTAAITPAPLTITANSTTKTYGSTVTFAGTEFTTTPLVNGETVGSATLASTGAAANASVAGSPYSITVSAATGGTFNPTNYNINYVPGTLTVNQAPAITITANPQNKTYGATANLGTTAFTPTGLVGGDAITGVTLTSAGTPATADAAAYNIVPSNEVGVNLANYAGVNYVNGTLTVNPALLTVTGTKVYDNTTAFATGQLSVTGSVNGQTVTLTGGTGTSSSATVNIAPGYTNSTLTNPTISVSGGTGNALASNYTVPTTGTLFITPANLTLAGGSKVYDGTTSVPAVDITSLSNLAMGDSLGGDLTITGTGSITSANVGSYSGGAATFSVTGLTLGGAAAPNYTLGAGTFSVTVKPLTITASNQSRVYGPTGGTLALGALQGANFTTNGLVPATGDSVTSVTLSATALSTAATTGVGTQTNAITPSAAAGSGLSNYSISYVNGNVSITPAPLTITANSTTKTYGSTVTFAGTEFTTTPLVNGETVGSATLASTGAAANASVAGSPYSITVSAATGGTFNPTNYNINYVPGTLTVNQAPAITITANPQNKTYGATANLGTTAFTPTGLVGGDAITGVTLTSAGTPATADVAAYNIVPSNEVGVNLANYAGVNYVNGTLTVNPALLTVTGTKVYDNTTGFATNQLTLTGGVNGQTVTLTGGTGTSASPNVNTYPNSPLAGLAITVSGGTGNALSSNYSLPGTGTLTITPATVTPTTTSTSASGGKVYDGTTVVPAATITSLSGLASGDALGGDLTITGTGSISSPNAGSYTGAAGTFSVAGLTLGGAAATNYTLAAGTYTVSAKPITITGSKSYDGTTTAAASTFAALTSQLVGGDAVALAGAGTLGAADAGNYSSANSGTAGLPLTGLSLTGGAAGNYALIAANYTVNPEAIVITAVPTTKTYDGTPSSPGTPIVTSGIIYPSDPGTLTQTYGGPNVGTNLTLTPTSTFPNSTNYTVTYVPVTTGVINPAPLTVTGTRLYDGQPDAPGSILTTIGELPGDPALTVTGTGTVATPNVGTTPLVSPGTLTLVGTGSGNYTISGGTVTITPAPLTISAVNTTKVYDGTTVSNGIPVATGLVGSDTITPLTQTYNSRNVLGTNGSTLTVTPGYTITDGNGGGNYTVVVNTSPGTITPEAITVIGMPVNKPYDGTPRAPGTPTVQIGTIYGPDIGIFTETYGGPNAGTNLTLTPTGTITDGNGGGNYVVTYVPVTTGTISPLPVILSGTRVYDGTTNAAASILTFSNDLDGSNLTLSGSGTLIAAAVGLEPISSFTGLALGGSAAGNYTLIGAIGNVQVTPDPPATPIQVMVPLNQTASGVSEVPSDFTIYDGGILYVKPTQNGIVTGTIATIDGQTYQPDNQLGCTLGPTGACVENGIAPSAGKAPAGAR